MRTTLYGNFEARSSVICQHNGARNLARDPHCGYCFGFPRAPKTLKVHEKQIDGAPQHGNTMAAALNIRKRDADMDTRMVLNELIFVDLSVAGYFNRSDKKTC